MPSRWVNGSGVSDAYTRVAPFRSDRIHESASSCETPYGSTTTVKPWLCERGLIAVVYGDTGLPQAGTQPR